MNGLEINNLSKKEIDLKELSKEMQDFLNCVSEASRDGGRSYFTTDAWLEKFEIEFPNVQGYYVTDFNIIESI